MSFHYDFCKVCHGVATLRCPFCKMTVADYRLTCDVCGILRKEHEGVGHPFNNLRHDAQVAHTLYLQRLWKKLQRYKMLTTGIFTLDEQLHGLWGLWRASNASESYARDVMRGKSFPEYLRKCDLGAEIERDIELLSHDKLVAMLLESS